MSAEPDRSGFGYFRESAPPLLNARTWILQGKKIPGGCTYNYTSEPTLIPESGWELRSIAIDMNRCRKLLEEGVSTDLASKNWDGSGYESEFVGPADAKFVEAAQLLSTRGAWQRVYWLDIVNKLLSADITQINWTYNGSTVSNGSTTGYWQWETWTHWTLGAHTVSQLYGAGSSSYRGQTTATFSNSWFCAPLPTVYTYYYYNRVWGFPDGTSTRSQSTDSVDECAPLHFGIQSAYGQWSP